MNRLTRRSFGKKMLAIGAASIVQPPSLLPQTSNPRRVESSTEPAVEVPDVIAGYTLTAEEKQLAAKYLANHEKNMQPLRATDLPNSLPPDFIFASPAGTGAVKK